MGKENKTQVTVQDAIKQAVGGFDHCLRLVLASIDMLKEENAVLRRRVSDLEAVAVDLDLRVGNVEVRVGMESKLCLPLFSAGSCVEGALSKLPDLEQPSEVSN
ncbi:MAG: hypothetical protein ACQCN6_01490 [Candidatus Bathyarchaeia archaeon]|jgi:hypothetical protein